MIDSHCHLHLCREAPEAILSRAAAAGLSGVVQCASDLPSSRLGLSLGGAGLPLPLRATAGLHVQHATEDFAPLMAELKELLSSGSFCAVGEAGLDAFRAEDTLGLQERLLRAQMELAVELDLPLVLHCRQASGRLLPLVRSFCPEPRLRGVWHCFDGTLAEAEDMISMGFHISFSGMLTYPGNKRLHQAARELRAERLLIETDSPYLSPEPRRGKPNEPSHLPLLLAFLAKLRGENPEELDRTLSANARALFSLGEGFL